MSAPWEVAPHIGVGPVRFGMTRQQVRDAIGMPFAEFKRTPGSRPADIFRAIGVVASYSADGGLEAIESSRLQEIEVAGLKLTVTSTEQLLQAIQEDPEAEVTPKGSGFISQRLGVGVWTEGEKTDPPQSVIIFADGYYS